MRGISAVLTFILLFSTAAVMVGIPTSEAVYISHNPILIESDIIDEHDGVTGGNGTELNPYVIEGWNIEHFDESCIYIKGCDAHYLIRNVYLTTSPDYQYLNHYGIHLEFSSNVTIEDCVIVDNYSGGIMAYGSSNLSIIDNELSGNTIYLGACQDVVVDGNQLSSTSIRLWGSVSVTMGNNTIDFGGIFIDGYCADDFSTHTIAATNTVGGGPVRYFKNLDSVTISGSYTGGEIIVVNCPGARIEDLTITNMSGLFMSYCDEVTLSNVQAVQTKPGLVLSHVSHTRIEDCSFTQSSWDQDLMLFVHAVISLQGATGIDIVNCTASQAGGRIDGIGISESTNVTIIGCNLSGHRGISSYQSTDSTFRGNSFERCSQDAVSLSECEGFKIFQNNFGANSVSSWPSDALNSWDGGYPDGGNYRDGYGGYDNFSGPDQDIQGPDGIRDAPLGFDRYPLMEPYTYPCPRAVFSIASMDNSTETYFLNASGCWDPNDPAPSLEVRWDFDGDGTWDTEWSTNKTTEAHYSTPGNYTIFMEVRNSQGLSTVTVKSLVIEGVPLTTYLIYAVVSMMILLVALLYVRRKRRRETADDSRRYGPVMTPLSDEPLNE